jgi:hypothetical protein
MEYEVTLEELNRKRAEREEVRNDYAINKLKKLVTLLAWYKQEPALNALITCICFRLFSSYI